VGTAGDCLHDGLQKYSVKLKEVDYDAKKNTITLHVKDIIPITIVLKHQAVAAPSLSAYTRSSALRGAGASPYGGVSSFLAEAGCGNCHKCGTPIEKPNSAREKVAAKYLAACGQAPAPAPSPPHPSPPSPGPSCTDVGPDSNSCADQKKWGKCGKSFMKGYCCKTCHDCKSGCGRSLRAQAFVPSQPRQLPNGSCSSQELALVLAIAMQESDSMEKTDTSKHGGAKNVSPFNMNLSELSLLGCNSQCADALGQHSSDYDWNGSVSWLLKGLRGGTAIGSTEDFLNYHRGGTTGWKDCKGKGASCDCGKYGCKAYRDAVADGAKLLLKSPSTMGNGQRVCEKVPYVVSTTDE
jgi:hypothetical protein